MGEVALMCNLREFFIGRMARTKQCGRRGRIFSKDTKLCRKEHNVSSSEIAGQVNGQVDEGATVGGDFCEDDMGFDGRGESKVARMEDCSTEARSIPPEGQGGGQSQNLLEPQPLDHDLPSRLCSIPNLRLLDTTACSEKTCAVIQKGHWIILEMSNQGRRFVQALEKS